VNTQGHSPEERERFARGAELRALATGTAQMIGRFVIQQVLGEGAFGNVYRALDPDLGREVAIKVPRGLSGATRAEFLREARAAAKIEQANVCPVYEVSPDGATIPYIVSRFIGGGTLSKLIEKNPDGLPTELALGIALKLAKGVTAAHAKGIVHRDLKPGNVLHDDENDEYLITDFGMAKLLVHASQTSGGTKGTPTYMSPEQFGDGRKSGDVGPASDIYALGIILYELLTGKPPFYDMPPFPLMFAHVQTPPDLPSSRRVDLSTQYDELCLKALKKGPTERYASAKAFAEALNAALRPAHSVGLPSSSGPTPTEIRAQAETEEQSLRSDKFVSPNVPDFIVTLDDGDKFFFGRDVAQDHGKARELYLMAAAQGSAIAKYNLGFMYLHGYGVEPDHPTACAWYERAATQGYDIAQLNLGILYERG
jgi:serine/threonine protein kinase